LFPPKLIPGLQGLERRLLDEVSGIVRVPGEPAGEVVEAVEMLEDQPLELWLVVGH